MKLINPKALAALRQLPPDEQRKWVTVARGQLHDVSLNLNGHDYDATVALIHAADLALQSDDLVSGIRSAPYIAWVRKWVQKVKLLRAGSTGPTSAAADSRQREALVEWMETVGDQVKYEGRDIDQATDNAIRSWRSQTTKERHALAVKNRLLIRQAILARSNRRSSGRIAGITASGARELVFVALGLDAKDDTAARTRRRHNHKAPGQ